MVGIDWTSVPGASVDEGAIVDIGTGEVRRLPATIASFRDATGYAVAPGGDVLLFQASTEGSTDNRATSCGGGNQGRPPFRDCQIFVANVDGTDLRQLTHASGGAIAGGWSPDGSRIAAIVDNDASRSGIIDLVLFDVSTGETTQLASGPASDFYLPHFSSDGEMVLVSRFQKYNELEGDSDEGSDVYGIPVSGGGAALVFEDRWNATISPDGRTMAYTKFISVNGSVGGPELWLADADGSEPRPVLVDEPFSDNPSWSSDGTRLLFSRLLLGEGDGVVVFDVTSGMPTFFVRTPGGAVGVWLDDDTLLIDVNA